MMVKPASGGLAFVRNGAIVVLERCTGEDDIEFAGVVANGLASEVGKFRVWISPGMTVGLASVVVQREDGWERSFVCGRRVTAAEVTRQLTVDGANDFEPGH